MEEMEEMKKRSFLSFKSRLASHLNNSAPLAVYSRYPLYIQCNKAISPPLAWLR